MKLTLATKSVLAGFIGGAALSFVVTLVITVWEWIENPGGIFHDASGTNWRFVFDLAVSWFWPTFVVGLIAFASMHLLYRFLIFRRKPPSDS